MELLVLFLFVEWIHDAISAWELKLIAPNLVESLRVKQLARAVTTAREQHGEVTGQFNCEDFVFVDITDHDGTVFLEVELNQTATIRAVVYGLVEGAPPSTVDLMVLWCLDSLLSFNYRLRHAVGEHSLRIINLHKTLTSVLIDHDEEFVAEGKFDLLNFNNRSLHLKLRLLFSVHDVVDLNTDCGCSC